MKGVELGTTKRMSEVIAEVAGVEQERIVVVSGPNLAKEIALKQPAASVVACVDEDVAEMVAEASNPRYFRPYTNTDVVGTELCGAVKNVIALAVGMAEGLGMGDNSKASIITRGLAETTRIGMALGADPMTFAGLAGVGDLIATCMSPLSRNRTFGLNLGRGMSVAEVVAVTRQTAEGVKSCESILAARSEARRAGPDHRAGRGGGARRPLARRGRRGADDQGAEERDGLSEPVSGVRVTGPSAQRRRAWSRSAHRSSTSSMPTESRSSSSGTAGGSAGCRRRRSIWDSTPPRLVEWVHSRVAAATCSAPSAPPGTSIDTIAPNPG